MGKWLSSGYRFRLEKPTSKTFVTRCSPSYGHFPRSRLRSYMERESPSGRKSATTQPRSCGHFGRSLLRCHVRQGSPSRLQLRSCSHLGGSLLCSYVRAESPSPFRLDLRASLRPALPLSLRVPPSPESDQSPPQRRLRAWRFADIPTPLPVQNIKSVGAVLIVLSICSASLAPDACAITSALARQRFCITSATGIALVPATPEPQTILSGSALASQHLAVNRSRAWGSM